MQISDDSAQGPRQGPGLGIEYIVCVLAVFWVAIYQTIQLRDEPHELSEAPVVVYCLVLCILAALEQTCVSRTFEIQ